MKITLIKPSMGVKEDGEPVKIKQIQPLAIATLAGLIPSDIQLEFYDDRIEEINYDTKTDLVAIATDTTTAKRAYQMSSEFRRRGTKVAIGGFHPTLMPEEAYQHADCVIIGEAEMTITKIINDLKNNNLQKCYKSHGYSILHGVRPRRDIFKGKKYLPFALVESGRGCRFSCDFCSIRTFFNKAYNRRPIEEIISEIKSLNKKFILFVDDNIISDFPSAKKFFKALVPLKIHWVSQATITIAYDEEMLDLLSKSGCVGLLIGFESLNKENLKQMNKLWNIKKIDYDSALKKIHSYGINVFASFIFGYDYDTKKDFEQALEFVTRNKVFIAGFNHLTPYPGTPLYERLKKEDRLLYDKWWLDSNYRFGDVVFKPKNMSAKELSNLCFEARKQFYSLKHITKRSFNLNYIKNPITGLLFFLINFYGRNKVLEEQGILLGKPYQSNFENVEPN